MIIDKLQDFVQPRILPPTDPPADKEEMERNACEGEEESGGEGGEDEFCQAELCQAEFLHLQLLQLWQGYWGWLPYVTTSC